MTSKMEYRKETQCATISSGGIKSGRTTRMLADAVRYAKSGRAVYVVAADHKHAEHLKNMSGKEASELGIKFETPSSLCNLDWNSLTLEGAHPNCKLLIDHYAIEYHFAKVLEMLHRYDTDELGDS